MSLTARLHITGHELEDKGIKILSCDFSFTQDVDNNGYINSSVRAGFINISIPGINDSEIVQWMINRFHRRNGKIVFLGVNESGMPQELKSLEFEEAFLVSYNESFSDEAEMIINLSISAPKITLSNGKWETQWDFNEEESL